ncbi:hypothetical protein FGK63_12005 [Ruegeria sediminis]|uniref:EF-hand domain-containing protein n=1 Tax=Ruegeria sediminis TaxID=2583820 RepID=A0ABY2WVQ6_9RHOB|nr:EF-hand domain-containing protein [Ruegeria sediminis]TMV06839.1 hypothetical protein FGK63_12005 [Ruegeria sediminis]
MKTNLALGVILGLTGAAALADEASMTEAELNAIDRNNDGFLSKEEFNAFSDYAFQAMDEDKNGTLTAAETRPYFEIKHFSAMDRNGDSLLSPDEFGAQMSADFATADQDGDGQLD